MGRRGSAWYVSATPRGSRAEEHRVHGRLLLSQIEGERDLVHAVRVLLVAEIADGLPSSAPLAEDPSATVPTHILVRYLLGELVLCCASTRSFSAARARPESFLAGALLI